MIKAVIFDLDDTLYYERDYVSSGLRAAAVWSEGNLGIPAESAFAEMQAIFDSGSRRKTFDEWLRRRGLCDSEKLEQLIRVYREHEPAIEPHPEVGPLLDQLRRRYRLGLLSDGWLAVQRRKLAALNLAQYFDAVVFSDELGRDAWKPSIRPYESVLHKLSCIAREAVYIGDNPTKDFLGARQLGLATVWLRRPGCFYTALQPATESEQADVSVESLNDVPALLQRLN